MNCGLGWRWGLACWFEGRVWVEEVGFWEEERGEDGGVV